MAAGTETQFEVGLGTGAAVEEALVPLAQLLTNERGVIREARVSLEDAALLRAMGLCDRATVKVCRQGEPCVVAVGGVRGLNVDPSHCTCGGSCRIGLARALAERIYVTRLGRV